MTMVFSFHLHETIFSIVDQLIKIGSEFFSLLAVDFVTQQLLGIFHLSHTCGCNILLSQLGQLGLSPSCNEHGLNALSLLV